MQRRWVTTCWRPSSRRQSEVAKEGTRGVVGWVWWTADRDEGCPVRVVLTGGSGFLAVESLGSRREDIRGARSGFSAPAPLEMQATR